MLRASATRALRQCNKSKRDLRHPLLQNNTSTCTRRGSFQPCSSAATTLLTRNRVRCLTNCAPVADTNATQNNGSLTPSLGRSSLLLGLGPQQSTSTSLVTCYQQRLPQRVLFSTKAVAQKSATIPSISLDSNDGGEEENTARRLSGPTTNIKKSGEKKSDASTKSPTENATPNTATTTTPNVTSATEKKEGGDASNFLKSTTALLYRALQSLRTLLANTPATLFFYLTQPAELRALLQRAKAAAIHEANHYWMGSKLLAADVRTARHIFGRTLRGSTLSRRERKQLLRTVTDVFRLVPMSIFVLIPFMEFALPFAVKLFPNMLPSTFRDNLKEEEKMKRELQMRISMAGFFQDTLTELAKEQKKVATEAIVTSDSAESTEVLKEESASAFLDFIEKARTGEAIPPDVIIKFSKYVEDDLTLDNMGRMQLINLCKYMGIPPYGSNDLLRFYLRHRIRVLKEDDQRITWEGIDSLTKMELREACRERGMRSTGLSKDAYSTTLQQWLDLSVQKNVPTSLLIMSRTFYLHDEMVRGEENESRAIDDEKMTVTGLADAMSGIDKEVLNEIILEMASSEEKSQNANVMKIALEVLEHQNELIKEEQQEREAAVKEKEEKEKEKAKDLELQDNAADAIASGEPLIKEEEVVDSDKTALSKDDEHKDKVESNSSEAPAVQEAENISKEEETTRTTNDEEQLELSTEDIDAISQLTSPDPVQKEREELQRIKDAMMADVAEETTHVSSDNQEQPDDDLAVDEDEQSRQQETADALLNVSSAISPNERIREKAQEENLEDAIEKEAKKVNVISMDGDIPEDKTKTEEEDNAISVNKQEGVKDAKLQKAINRLKSRVESMVGKIEIQMTDVESKIGNKFHLLDKDGDGVLTLEELVQVLQTVLKTELTSEEAKAIASDIDQNKDGVFSIAELAQWCETNTIVKLAEEGREKDLDDMIMERVQERRKLKEEDDVWTGM